MEVKSGATLAQDWFDALSTLPGERCIVYGGDEAQTRHGVRAVPWRAMSEEGWLA